MIAAPLVLYLKTAALSCVTDDVVVKVFWVSSSVSPTIPTVLSTRRSLPL